MKEKIKKMDLNIFIFYKILVSIKGNIFRIFLKSIKKFEKIIKDIRNLFRLKKEQNNIAIKMIRNLFRIETEIKGIKDIVLKSIKNLFEYKKEKKYYKPVRVNNFWNNN